VKACVDAQYRLRTSELQAAWRLLPPKTVFYACQNNTAIEVVASFFDTDPATIRLERGDRTKTLWRVGDASAGKYEAQNVSLVHQGSELKLSWLDTDTGKTDELQCKARLPPGCPSAGSCMPGAPPLCQDRRCNGFHRDQGPHDRPLDRQPPLGRALQRRVLAGTDPVRARGLDGGGQAAVVDRRPGGCRGRRTGHAAVPAALAGQAARPVLLGRPVLRRLRVRRRARHGGAGLAADLLPGLLGAERASGQKTAVFQGMQHIGSEDFYKSVVFDLEQALADGYTLFYEGVTPMAGRPDLTD